MRASAHQPIFFVNADLQYPCIEDAALTPNGQRVELAGRRPSDRVADEVRLMWRAKTEAPDLLHHVSTSLFISEKGRRCWQLEDGDELTLRAVTLVNRRKEVLRRDYWWVDVHEEHGILDEDHSVIERHGRAILRVPVFRVAWNRVPDLDLFLCASTFAHVVSSAIVERSRFERLTGARFVPVDGSSWP